jgi:hypothetical protein
MKKLYVFVVIFALAFGLIIFYIINQDKLSHPEIFKGIKLGIDIDSAVKIINENGTCEKIENKNHYCRFEISKFIFPFVPEFRKTKNLCQYALTSDIYAHPQLFHSKYKGKKVVSSAYLLFHSPFTFPQITVKKDNYLGSEGIFELLYFEGIPSVDSIQMNKIIAMFDSKYGVRKYHGNHLTEYVIGTLNIKLHKYKYGIDIKFQEGEVEEKNAWLVFAVFDYIKVEKELFENEKTTNDGEIIGDKI